MNEIDFNEAEVFGLPAIKTNKIPRAVVWESLKIPNHLRSFIVERFTGLLAEPVLKKYVLGGSNHWPGASVFWQVDYLGNPRAGKIMLYDPATGKRRKDGRFFTWYHVIHKNPAYELKQCFFGEHLLKTYPTKPVGIVESEKTALICAITFPDFVWIASGGLANLTRSKCAVLRYRDIHLFPDQNGSERWGEIAENIPELFKASMNILPELNTGEDIADIVLQILDQKSPVSA